MNQSQQAAAEPSFEIWLGQYQLAYRNAAANMRAAWEAGRAAGILASSPQPAEGLYVECRQCDDCDHLGINDASDTDASCTKCDWRGAEPQEDRCPKCGETDCMSAACPECGGRYMFLADLHIPIASPAAAPAEVPTAAPWDQKSARERRLALIEELETESERLTRYTNSPRDGLLVAAAQALRDCDAAPAASPSAPAQVPAGPFDHLAGRGMHELRFDELTPYVLSILEDPVAVEAAVAWIVSELARKTNDERAIAVQLAALREAATPPSSPPAATAFREPEDGAQPPVTHVNWMRSYGQRAAQIIAFNSCNGDLDAKLEAVHEVICGKPKGWLLAWERDDSAAAPTVGKEQQP